MSISDGVHLTFAENKGFKKTEFLPSLCFMNAGLSLTLKKSFVPSEEELVSSIAAATK